MGRLILSLTVLVALLSSCGMQTRHVTEAKNTESIHVVYLNFQNLYLDFVETHKAVKIAALETTKEETKKHFFKIFNVTAYTAGIESTGKTPDDPTYGITASGEKVKENYTAACPKSMSFGTKLYIPSMNNTYVCQDRGSAITEGHIDIYMESLNDALEFGRKDLEVEVIKPDET